MTTEEIVLHEGGRAEPEASALDYTAYYRTALTEDSETTRQIRASAAGRDVRAVLVLDGSPFAGMACAVSFGLLTEEELADFRTRFAPDEDCAIRVL